MFLVIPCRYFSTFNLMCICSAYWYIDTFIRRRTFLAARYASKKITLLVQTQCVQKRQHRFLVVFILSHCWMEDIKIFSNFILKVFLETTVWIKNLLHQVHQQLCEFIFLAILGNWTYHKERLFISLKFSRWNIQYVYHS